VLYFQRTSCKEARSVRFANLQNIFQRKQKNFHSSLTNVLQALHNSANEAYKLLQRSNIAPRAEQGNIGENSTITAHRPNTLNTSP
jgi:hypothetical protein